MSRPNTAFAEVEYLPAFVTLDEGAAMLQAKYNWLRPRAVAFIAAQKALWRRRDKTSVLVSYYLDSDRKIEAWKGRRAYPAYEKFGFIRPNMDSDCRRAIVLREVGEGRIYFTKPRLESLYDKLFGEPLCYSALHNDQKEESHFWKCTRKLWYLWCIPPPDEDMTGLGYTSKQITYRTKYAGLNGLKHSRGEPQNSEVLQFILNVNGRSGNKAEDWTFAQNEFRSIYQRGAFEAYDKVSGVWNIKPPIKAPAAPTSTHTTATVTPTRPEVARNGSSEGQDSGNSLNGAYSYAMRPIAYFGTPGETEEEKLARWAKGEENRRQDQFDRELKQEGGTYYSDDVREYLRQLSPLYESSQRRECRKRFDPTCGDRLFSEGQRRGDVVEVDGVWRGAEWEGSCGR